MIRYLLLSMLAFIVSCSSLDQERVHSPYYNGERFTNLDPDEEVANKSFFTVMKWKIFGPEDPPAVAGDTSNPPPVRDLTQGQLFPEKDGVKISWLGHATALLSFRKGNVEKTVITDPIFHDVPFVERQVKLPIELLKLPRIDYVVISHNHFDHCDLDTLKELLAHSPKIIFIMPEGMKPWALANGLENITILRWYEKHQDGDLSIHMMPAQHWSRRAAFDFMQNHWGSYVVEMNDKRVYFGGDTAYGRHFKMIKERFPGGFDAALLPIGAYSPRWFMKSAHVDPPEALRANRDLGSPLLLPIHWGTFKMADETLGEPIEYLRSSALESDPIAYWDIGGQVTF